MMFTQSVECPCCGKNFAEDWSDYITSSDVVEEDRESRMGAEIEHTIECDEIKCPNCGKLLSVSGSIWEYPEGAYNYHELQATEI